MNLVVIQGQKAYRYEGAKRIEEADLDWEAVTIEQMRALIEDFRVNGAPPPIIQPADIAFHRAAIEMVTKRPLEGMELAQLLHACTLGLKPGDFAGGHRYEDIVAEIKRRGIDIPSG